MCCQVCFIERDAGRSHLSYLRDDCFAEFTLNTFVPLSAGSVNVLAMTIRGSDYFARWRRAFCAQLSSFAKGMVLMTSDLPIQARRAVATPKVMFSN